MIIFQAKLREKSFIAKEISLFYLQKMAFDLKIIKVIKVIKVITRVIVLMVLLTLIA